MNTIRNNAPKITKSMRRAEYCGNSILTPALKPKMYITIDKAKEMYRGTPMLPPTSIPRERAIIE